MMWLILSWIYAFGLGAFGYYSYSRKDRPKADADRADFYAWYIMNVIMVLMWPVIILGTAIFILIDRKTWQA